MPDTHNFVVPRRRHATNRNLEFPMSAAFNDSTWNRWPHRRDSPSGELSVPTRVWNRILHQPQPSKQICHPPRQVTRYPIVRSFHCQHPTIHRQPGPSCLACTTLERSFRPCLCNRRSSVHGSVSVNHATLHPPSSPEPSPPPSTIATLSTQHPGPAPQFTRVRAKTARLLQSRFTSPR
jgi:hypothetical protein